MADHDYKKYPELTNKQLETMELESPHKQITEDFMATVVKVHDGDTITLRVDFREFDFPLRLLNIDAPEMSEGGEEARDYLKGVILDEEVEIKIDRNNRVGKYGRLLGKVVSLGMDMGEALVRLGYAVPFGKKNEGQPINLNKLMRLNQWF
jgi:endonuclease YncB( thermonuclease family)